MRERVLETVAVGAVALRARVLDLLSQAELQFARGLLGEGHRDDLADARPALGECVDHARHQFGRLAGASRRLDDERRVEVVPNAGAVRVVDERRTSHGHFILRSCVSSSSGRWSLRRGTDCATVHRRREVAPGAGLFAGRSGKPPRLDGVIDDREHFESAFRVTSPTAPVMAHGCSS